MLASRMPRIAAVAPALPANVYSQAGITAAIGPLLTRDPSEQALINGLYGGNRGDSRRLVWLLGDYRDRPTVTESTDSSTDMAADQVEESLRRALVALREPEKSGRQGIGSL